MRLIFGALLAALVTIVPVGEVLGQVPAPDPHPQSAPSGPTYGTLTSLKPTFFIVTEPSDTQSGVAMTLGVANEFRKAMKPLRGAVPWIVPETSWHTPELLKQCQNDPMAVGGVVITFYTGAASHFYLVYQEETQTFELTAELVSCNRERPTADAAPTVVGVIAELPGAHGTPWVVRRSQVSIPLITFAGLATLFSHANTAGNSTQVKSGPDGSITTTTSSTNANVTGAAILASLFSQSSNRDIPGYSTPLKLRAASQTTGVDLLRAIRDLCTSHSDLPGGVDATPRDKLCTALGLTLNPAEIDKQQKALDDFEAAERDGQTR